jgi:hypothetical protein
MQKIAGQVLTFLSTAGAIALCSLPLVWAALSQGIDGDEGFYLLAARLVLDGKQLYSDFMYPQMPLMPYAYAGWFQVFGIGWLSARIFTALLGVVLLWLVFSHVRSTQGSSGAVLAVILVGFASLVAPWLAVAKTYALTTVLLFGAYAALMKSVRERIGFFAFVAGLCFGLCVSTRLLVAPCSLIFVWILWRRGGLRFFGLWLLGGLLGLAPAIFFAVLDPAAFWFNNIAYHGLRSNHSWSFQAFKKLELLALLFGLDGRLTGPGLQLLLLTTLAVIQSFWSIARGRTIDAALLFAVIIFVVSILPNPAFVQYFVVAVPFLAVAATQWIAEMLERAQVSGGWLRSLGVMVLAAVGLAVYCMAPHFPLKPIVQLSDASDIAAVLRTRLQKDDVVLSFWPGFLLETTQPSASGFENHFALRVASQLEQPVREKFRLATFTDAKELVVSAQVKAVVIPIPLLQKGVGGKKFRSWLSESGYGAVQDSGGYRVYIRRS